MSARPLVGVRNGDAKSKVDQHVVLPAVFTVPIRPDLVEDVHSRMNKNKRQAYAVSKYAGHQTSAESWGTGRAVARIPRVAGGGTHRAGQGAFGNMCRGGRMFAPTKTWRRWHRKINVNEKRFALASAIAASAIPALVMARGHKIDNVPEIPLVVDNKIIDNVDKSSKAVALLKSLAAYQDVEKVKESRAVRSGKGKLRNRRYRQRRGPLVIFNEKGPLTKAFRNLPGIELCSVNRLNLLQLAPGGHLGRFCIWTKDAFARLDKVYGSYTRQSEKVDYTLPRSQVTNADLGRLVNSTEVQNVLRSKRFIKRQPMKRNPLRNFDAMVRLNPHAITVKRREAIYREKANKKRSDLLESKRKGEKPAPVDEKVKAARKQQAKKASEAKKRFSAVLLAK